MREKRVLSRLIHDLDFTLFNSHYPLTIHPPCWAGLFSWIAMQYNRSQRFVELLTEASLVTQLVQAIRCSHRPALHATHFATDTAHSDCAENLVRKLRTRAWNRLSKAKPEFGREATRKS